VVRQPWLLLTGNPGCDAELFCSGFPDSKADVGAGKLIEMMLLVLIETVGRGTFSDREGVDLLTTLVTRDTMGEDAMETVEIGWEVTAVTVTEKGMATAAEAVVTEDTGAIEETCDKETDTVDAGPSCLAVVEKLAELVAKLGKLVVTFGVAKDDTFGTSGVEAASNLVTVAVGGVALTKEAEARVVDVSVTSGDDWFGTLVTITELEVVSTTEGAESEAGVITGARTARLRGCSPLAETTESLMSGMAMVGVEGADC